MGRELIFLRVPYCFISFPSRAAFKIQFYHLIVWHLIISKITKFHCLVEQINLLTLRKNILEKKNVLYYNSFEWKKKKNKIKNEFSSDKKCTNIWYPVWFLSLNIFRSFIYIHFDIGRSIILIFHSYSCVKVFIT